MRTQRTRGVSLFETVVYVTLVSVTLFFVMATLFTMTRAYSNARVTIDLTSAGNAALERLSREIQSATSIDQANSTFASTTSVLQLNTTNASGTASTVKFYVVSGGLQVDEGGVNRGSLTKPTVSVTKLYIQRFATTTSEGVKIDLTIQAGQGSTQKSSNFYTTAVLRGSYK